jgi:hypothetical protein
MTRLRQDSEAKNLLNHYLHDPATPLEGRLQLMLSDASWKIRTKRASEGISIFSSMASLAPSHHLSAEAYYWLALSSKKQGNEAKCVSYAEKIQIAQGSRKGLLVDWQLDCKALLLRAGLTMIPALRTTRYSADFQTKCLARIQSDLGKI